MTFPAIAKRNSICPLDAIYTKQKCRRAHYRHPIRWIQHSWKTRWPPKWLLERLGNHVNNFGNLPRLDTVWLHTAVLASAGWGIKLGLILEIRFEWQKSIWWLVRMDYQQTYFIHYPNYNRWWSENRFSKPGASATAMFAVQSSQSDQDMKYWANGPELFATLWHFSSPRETFKVSKHLRQRFVQDAKAIPSSLLILPMILVVIKTLCLRPLFFEIQIR